MRRSWVSFSCRIGVGLSEYSPTQFILQIGSLSAQLSLQVALTDSRPGPPLAYIHPSREYWEMLYSTRVILTSN